MSEARSVDILFTRPQKKQTKLVLDKFKYKLEKMLSNPYRGQEHSVYVIRSNTGSVKVGVSTDPRSRLAHIQKSTPAAPVLDYAAVVTPDEFGEAAFVLESYAYSLMKDKCLHGEWFDTTSDHAP
jgi:hypothetical protein